MHSPKLRACMDHIAEIVKQYDVGAVVTLHDGEGMSEFRLMIDTPSWSNLEFQGNMLRIKVPAKTDPKNAGMVVNMIWAAEGLTAQLNGMLTQIKYEVTKRMTVESNEGKTFPRF